jgi:hypothetical protein
MQTRSRQDIFGFFAAARPRAAAAKSLRELGLSSRFSLARGAAKR